MHTCDAQEQNLMASSHAYEKLLSNVASLADAMDEDMPDLPEGKLSASVMNVAQ